MKKLLGIALGIALLGSCSIIPSERSGFCLTCHRAEGVYKNLDLSASHHSSYREKEKACAACHSDKTLGRSLRTNARHIEAFSADVTSVRLYERELLGETDRDEMCLSCHTDALEKKEMDVFELPLKLKKLGLNYDHFVHRAYKRFSAEDTRDLKILEKKKEEGTLSAEEVGRLELLSKIARANCAGCHEKTRVSESGQTFDDKNINYAARNPMLCTACHYDIDLVQHPGKKKGQLPSEESCRRCHDGKLHGGNLRVFLADCENGAERSECVKCHPSYSQETP